MDNEVKRVFTPKPMISFRSARKRSSYLVRAKLYPTERTIGSYKCGGKRCEVCINVNETSTFNSTAVHVLVIKTETQFFQQRAKISKRELSYKKKVGLRNQLLKTKRHP